MGKVVLKLDAFALIVLCVANHVFLRSQLYFSAQENYFSTQSFVIFCAENIWRMTHQENCHLQNSSYICAVI